MSRAVRKTLRAVIQDALRLAHRERLKQEFGRAQDFWSKKARERGVLTEEELERRLR